jgi:hypothetical protein
MRSQTRQPIRVKTKGLYIRIEPGRLAKWHAQAAFEKMTLSEWIRTNCDSALKK